MTKRTAPKPDAPIPAESWFVDLINYACVAASAQIQGANADAASEIESDAWANLARCCVAAPWEG